MYGADFFRTVCHRNKLSQDDKCPLILTPVNT